MATTRGNRLPGQRSVLDGREWTAPTSWCSACHVVAVPVGAAQTCRMLQAEADEVICAMVPEDFQAVGLWYEDFGQTSDAEVQATLREAAH